MTWLRSAEAAVFVALVILLAWWDSETETRLRDQGRVGGSPPRPELHPSRLHNLRPGYYRDRPLSEREEFLMNEGEDDEWVYHR